MSTRIKDTDHGYRDLIRRVYGMQKRKIEVGILEGSGSEDSGLSILQVAIWNEFGNSRIPERSFIRAWFDANKDKCKEGLVAMCKLVLAGKIDKEAALEQLAQRFVGEIQAKIAEGVPPPNDPKTVARKGSSTPLIDTGTMRSAVNYRVT